MGPLSQLRFLISSSAAMASHTAANWPGQGLVRSGLWAPQVQSPSLLRAPTGHSPGPVSCVFLWPGPPAASALHTCLSQAWLALAWPLLPGELSLFSSLPTCLGHFPGKGLSQSCFFPSPRYSGTFFEFVPCTPAVLHHYPQLRGLCLSSRLALPLLVYCESKSPSCPSKMAISAFLSSQNSAASPSEEKLNPTVALRPSLSLSPVLPFPSLSECYLPL